MPTRRILIDPVTRIEGHAKITIVVDDAGEVTDARFHVTEFRGFETFCQGRPVWEMPALCARVCGICPVTHLLASSKAGDMILGVAIPAAADKLRRLANMAQIVQSHALSFFHLSARTCCSGSTRHRSNATSLPWRARIRISPGQGFGCVALGRTSWPGLLANGSTPHGPFRAECARRCRLKRAWSW